MVGRSSLPIDEIICNGILAVFGQRFLDGIGRSDAHRITI